MELQNVVMVSTGPDHVYDLSFKQNQIHASNRGPNRTPSPPSLVLPTLCHPHIHLDKAYLLTSHPKPSTDTYPDYSDLGLEKGDFPEALSKTAQAKERYTVPDLVFRGSQLLLESIQAGVTSMRAFVEIDHVTKFKCLDAALELKQKFNHLCYIQICAFAQDPIMSTEHGEKNRKLMEEALEKYQEHIEVLGTTPYVEGGTPDGLENIKWAIQTAMQNKLHLDFHLDYNTKADGAALIWDVIKLLKSADWSTNKTKRVVIGHCTRMTLFSEDGMKQLAEEIGGLPVAFVGLPTSDLFMMGRPSEDTTEKERRERGTMQVVDIIQKYGLQACIGVNNAGNAFTPWGSADPLRLACLGVGLYHAGTAEQAQILYECVSTRARYAIGVHNKETKTPGKEASGLHLTMNEGEGILVIQNEEYIQCSEFDGQIPARQRLTVMDVVWDPPELRLRRVARSKK